MNIKIYRIIVATFLIVIIVLVGFDYYKDTQHEKKEYDDSLIKETNPYAKVIKGPTPTRLPSPISWKFRIQNNTTNETLVTFEDNYFSYYNNVQQWGDFLFYRPYQRQDTQLGVYNLKTHESFAIDMSPYMKETLTFDTFYVIGNELFISIGGYMQKGGLYHISLPLNSSSKPTLVYEGSNPKIISERGKFFIRGGEGDSCWGQAEYNLFDPDSKEVTYLLTSHHGCNYGDEFLDFDNADRMIIANHKENTNLDVSEFTFQFSSVYTHIYAIPLSNPSQKIMLLEENNMPVEIRAVQFYPEKNKIMLFGPTSYLFDVSTKELTIIATIPTEQTYEPGPIRWVGNYICVTTYNSRYNFSNNIVINLQDNTQEISASSCPGEVSPTPAPSYDVEQKERLREELNKLSLPSEFTIVEN